MNVGFPQGDGEGMSIWEDLFFSHLRMQKAKTCFQQDNGGEVVVA